MSKQEKKSRYGHPLQASMIYLVCFVLLCLAPWLVSASSETSSPGFAPTADRINVAAAENGGSATASSIQDDYTPDAVINGDRRGVNLTTGGGWRDNTSGVFPDFVDIEFAGPATIDEVSVFTQQDAWWAPVEPTETLSFFNNGVTAFQVQSWNGSAWVTIPGLSVTNNNKVWRRFTFAPLQTTKIRVVVNAARIAFSTLVEVEAFGVFVNSPDPTPTPTPGPTPDGTVESALAARDIFFDAENNVGIGTTIPIFNDDGVTGAFVGKWFAIDGRLPGAAAYLGLGGNVPTPGHRVGVLNFYNIAMGGVDHRTAAIYSFNGPTIGTGNLEFYTSPNFIGPVRRMQIAPTGEIGINHAAGAGTQVSIMGRSTTSSTKALVVLDGQDRSILTVRDDGQITIGKPGQGLVLKSPNGLVCRKLVINDAGEFIVEPMGSCPP